MEKTLAMYKSNFFKMQDYNMQKYNVLHKKYLLKYFNSY